MAKGERNMAGIQYSIKKNRLEKALYKGITHDAMGDRIYTKEEGDHYMILPALDSGVEDCQWGRIRFSMNLPENCVCYLYAAASNERTGEELLMDREIGLMDKKRFLSSITCLRFINKSDVLLYEIEGRYLWIAVEIIGEGVTIENMVVQAPGDNFMQLFPEVYRQKNSFFHRYLSIFSSIYNDFDDRLTHQDALLDIEQAPAELLELYVKWLGIDVRGGFLEEKELRALLREARDLIQYKGTKWSIERICELLIGEKPVIVERGLMQRYVRGTEQEIYDRLYGSTPYDVTLLIGTIVDKKKEEQLLHLLRQFKPVRSRLHIVFLKDSGILDEYSYLDKNAVTFEQKVGALDLAQVLDGTIILQ